MTSYETDVNGHPMVLFFTWRSVFSNHYGCRFYDKKDNIHYTSSEQRYMHKKAQFFNDDYSAMRILSTKSPSEQKTIGKSAKGFQQVRWDTVSSTVMRESLFLKFRQNDDLLRTLLETADSTHVSCRSLPSPSSQSDGMEKDRSSQSLPSPSSQSYGMEKDKKECRIQSSNLWPPANPATKMKSVEVWNNKQHPVKIVLPRPLNRKKKKKKRQKIDPEPLPSSFSSLSSPKKEDKVIPPPQSTSTSRPQSTQVGTANMKSEKRRERLSNFAPMTYGWLLHLDSLSRSNNANLTKMVEGEIVSVSEGNVERRKLSNKMKRVKEEESRVIKNKSGILSKFYKTIFPVNQLLYSTPCITNQSPFISSPIHPSPSLISLDNLISPNFSPLESTSPSQPHPQYSNHSLSPSPTPITTSLIPSPHSALFAQPFSSFAHTRESFPRKSSFAPGNSIAIARSIRAQSSTFSIMNTYTDQSTPPSTARVTNQKMKRIRESRDQLKREVENAKRMCTSKDREISQMNTKVKSLENTVDSQSSQLISVKKRLTAKIQQMKATRKRSHEQEEDFVMSLQPFPSRIVTKERGEYTIPCKKTMVEMKTQGVSDENVGPVMKIVMRSIVGCEISDAPSASTVARMAYAGQALAQEHTRILLDKMISGQTQSYHGMAILSDETTKGTHKMQSYSATFRGEDGKIKTQVLGIRAVASKDAQTSLDTVLELLDELDRSPSSSQSVHFNVSGDFKDIVMAYTNSAVGDRASTQTKFAEMVNQYRRRVLPTVVEGWDKMNRNEQNVHLLFLSVPCFVHITASLSEPICAAMAQHEFLLTKSDDAAEGKVSSLALIMDMINNFGARASPKYGTYRDYAAWCDCNGYPKEALPTLKGSRFNIIPAVATRITAFAGQYLDFIDKHKHHILGQLANSLRNELNKAQLHVLALVDIYLTGPIWRVSNGSMNILDTSTFVGELLEWIDERVLNPQLLFQGGPPKLSVVAATETPFRIGREAAQIVLQRHATTLSLDAGKLAMQAAGVFLRRAFAPFLPGGQYYRACKATGTISAMTRSAFDATPTNNVPSEAVFGLVDYIITRAPNMRISRVDSETLLRKNNTFGWLNTMPMDEQERMMRKYIKRGPILEANAQKASKKVIETIFERVKLESQNVDKTTLHIPSIAEKLEENLRKLGFLETIADLDELLATERNEKKLCQKLCLQLQIRRTVLRQKSFGAKCFTTSVSSTPLSKNELEAKVRNAIIKDPNIRVSIFCNADTTKIIRSWGHFYKGKPLSCDLLACAKAAHKAPSYALMKYLSGTGGKFIVTEEVFTKWVTDGTLRQRKIVVVNGTNNEEVAAKNVRAAVRETVNDMIKTIEENEW